MLQKPPIHGRLSYTTSASNTIVSLLLTKSQSESRMPNFGNSKYSDCTSLPYPGSMASMCIQLSEVQNRYQDHSLSPDSPTQIALRGSEKSCDSRGDFQHGNESKFGIEQHRHFEQNFEEQQMQRLARGRYKCSRCGALKVISFLFFFFMCVCECDWCVCVCEVVRVSECEIVLETG